MNFFGTTTIFFLSSTDTIRGKMFDVIFSPTRKVSKDVNRRIDEGKRIIAIKMFTSTDRILSKQRIDLVYSYILNFSCR